MPTRQERSAPDPLELEQVLSTCRWCGGHHPYVCPYIKRVRYHPNGAIAEVVLKERTRHEDAIIYPGDDEEEEKAQP